MSTEAIDIGSISSRGQVAIPSEMRKMLGLEEGSKVLFVVEKDTLLMKKVTTASFAEITKPLKEAAKQADFKEEDVNEIVHRFRKSKR